MIAQIRWFFMVLLMSIMSHGISRAAAKPAADLCPADLPAAIEATINQPSFARSRWGILVQTVDRASRQTLYAHEAERFFMPASNAKLLTTAAAIKTLGSQFRWRTSVYGVNTAAGWQLHLVGRGDASFTAKQLQQLAQQLRQRGIRQVTQLIADDSAYQGDWLNPRWTWGDLQAGYGAPANSLIVDENLLELKVTPQQLGQPLRVTWVEPEPVQEWQVINQTLTVAMNQPEAVEARRTDQPIVTVKGQLQVGSEPDFVSISIANPAQNFLSRFQQALAQENIRVDRATVITRPQPIPTPELAFVESAPLPQLLKTMNYDSNNLYAESLLRSLGSQRPLPPNTTTLEAGLVQLKTALTRLGIDPQSFSSADGAGLSRHNLATPTALVQILQVMQDDRSFRASLPIAGQSGTLEYRFRGTPAAGIVQAKTGTLADAVALSGYVQPPNYSPLAFSLILNHSSAPKAEAREAIDQIVVLLTRLRSCRQQ
jgi:serine-type D-Ala-D-Ala carboxypeptidase/endopeptidase (penicillin-binding protein 4)